MLLKRNYFKQTTKNKKSDEESENERHQEENENERHEEEIHKDEGKDKQNDKSEKESEHNIEEHQHDELNEKEQNGDRPDDEREVNLKSKKRHETYNISDTLNLYYDTVSQLENDLSKLKRERKNMKITYINQYLNKTKLSSEENAKRQELKNKLLENGEEMIGVKQKLNKIRDDIIQNLELVKFE